MTRRIPAGEPGLSQGGRKRYDAKSLPPVADDQQAFFNPPRARNHIDRRDGTLVRDPETSVSAARSVSLASVTRVQRSILNVLRLARKPMSDEQIIESLSWMRASESGIRSRRAELLRAGLLEVVDSKGLTRHRRPCRRYQVRAQRGAV
jgi:hypothetical protein